MPAIPTSLALVTGANRGIGREVARQLADLGYEVLLGARDLAKGQQAAAELRAESAVRQVEAVPLDVADPASIERLRAEVVDRYGRLDVLVNNAGILYDTWQHATTVDLA